MICRWLGGGGGTLLGGGGMVVGAVELAALALGWGRVNWLEAMPPKKGPQERGFGVGGGTPPP